MGEHRYILEPYKGMCTRYHCPACKQSYKTFTRYIDTEQGEHINTDVGRCSRENKCGYHYAPKQYFEDNKHLNTQPKNKFDYHYKHARTNSLVVQLKPISFIPVDVFQFGLKGYENNNFVKFLIDLFGDEITKELVNRYYIGTSKLWDGATVFWQIDVSGKIRTGKIMLYDTTTGKRIKEPFNHINWVHKIIKQPEFELKQCLFGEHLLKDKTKPVAIVESEKTAIIASVYLSQFIWLAVGSLNNLNEEKCSILKGRIVLLFPDLNGFEKWSNKAKELSHITKFIVSNLLEREATETERKQGLDLADYLIQFSYKEFVKKTETQIKPIITETLTDNQIIEPSKKESWEQIIKELEYYFDTVTLPTLPLKLNSYITIVNVPLFIKSHFTIVKANINKRTFLPYLERLNELNNYLFVNRIIN